MSDIDKRRRTRDESGGADPEVTRFLRDSYRAPATPGYWDGLEARIMSRVRQSVRASGSVPAVAVEWWQVLSGWVAPGAWAAGIAALVALGVMLQSRAAERRTAYAAALEATAVAGTTVGGGGGGSGDSPSSDATRRPDRIVRPDESGPRHPHSDAARDAALRDLLLPR
jgi:hypothetical protein